MQVFFNVFLALERRKAAQTLNKSANAVILLKIESRKLDVVKSEQWVKFVVVELFLDKRLDFILNTSTRVLDPRNYCLQLLVWNSEHLSVNRLINTGGISDLKSTGGITHSNDKRPACPTTTPGYPSTLE